MKKWIAHMKVWQMMAICLIMGETLDIGLLKILNYVGCFGYQGILLYLVPALAFAGWWLR